MGLTLEPVSTSPVTLSPVRSESMADNIQPFLPVWTPNYNNLTSYIDIPPFFPSGANWQFEADLHALDTITDHYVYEGRDDNGIVAHGYFLIHPNGATDSPSATIYINGVEDARIYTGVTASVRVVHGTLTDARSLRRLGARYNGRQLFNGQMSNIRITDLDNPDNSRQYPSVIESVTMPSTIILRESMGDRVDAWGGNGLSHTFSVPDLPDGSLIEGTSSASLEAGHYTTTCHVSGNLSGSIRLVVGSQYIEVGDGESYSEDVLDLTGGNDLNTLQCLTGSESGKAGSSVTVSVEKANDWKAV